MLKRLLLGKKARVIKWNIESKIMRKKGREAERMDKYSCSVSLATREGNTSNETNKSECSQLFSLSLLFLSISLFSSLASSSLPPTSDFSSSLKSDFQLHIERFTAWVVVTSGKGAKCPAHSKETRVNCSLFPLLHTLVENNRAR